MSLRKAASEGASPTSLAGYGGASLQSETACAEQSDDQIMHVAEGQEIKLRFEGFGTATIDATVDRIRPSSAIRDSKNVYIVEAIVDNENGELRPGMKGTARIYGDKHAWGWNLFHLPWERFVAAIGF